MICKNEYEEPELIVLTFVEGEDVLIVSNDNEVPLPSIPV